MAEKLMEEATSATSGRASLTLARGDELTIVLIAMKSEATLVLSIQHPQPPPSLCSAGTDIFTTSNDKITLEQGESVTFTADILHSVHASEDSAFLIVIGGSS